MWFVKRNKLPTCCQSCNYFCGTATEKRCKAKSSVGVSIPMDFKTWLYRASCCPFEAIPSGDYIIPEMVMEWAEHNVDEYGMIDARALESFLMRCSKFKL